MSSRPMVPRQPDRSLGRLGAVFGAALSAGLLALPVQGAVIRVDVATGADNPGCGSAASPCASIQQAVNLASDGDVIRVAQGTYTYQPALDPCGTDTGAVCILGKTLTLSGGFAPPNWTTPNPASNPTIIDGEDAIRGLLALKGFAASPTLTVDGFTIRRGRATGLLGDPNGLGGGIKALLLTSITLEDLVVEDCFAIGDDTSSGPGGIGAGGGVYISTSVPALPATQVTLRRLSFLGNQALGGDTTSDDRGGFGEGGGLFVNKSNVNGFDLVFENNRAAAGNAPGSGLTGAVRSEALGGGMAVLRDATVTLQGFMASGNSVQGGNASNATGTGGTGAGGGLYVEGSFLLLKDGDFRDNSSTGGAAATGGLGSGGGITSFDADVVLDRVALIHNQTTGGDGPTTKGTAGGGGAYLERALDPDVTATVTNAIIADNQVTLGTGGGTVGGGGAGLFALGEEVTVVHTTFAQNVLGSSTLFGQAVVVVPRAANPGHATLQDCVIADHTSFTNKAAVHAQTANSSVTFVDGLFAGNDLNTNNGIGNFGTFTGLATMDTAVSVLFESPGTPNFDYHLTSSSPAIDQATNSSTEDDIDGNRRRAPRDWGADELCSAVVNVLALSNATVNNSRVEEACQEITADTYTVKGSGSVTLRAGTRVVLGNGFAVENGGQLVVDLSLP